MGGGDLNMKKSWHPLLMKNQERVWKEERKALEERKKTAQLQKELAEERQLQELQRLHAAQGGGVREERVEWLYATPATGTGISSEEQEAYLLGKKTVDKLFKEKDEAAAKLAAKAASQADAEKPGGGFISLQSANTARDTAAKIREDPLLAIKQQEQAAYEALKKNPARLNALKDQIKSKEERKLEKEARKKQKHDRREKKRQREDDDIIDERDRLRRVEGGRSRDGHKSSHAEKTTSEADFIPRSPQGRRTHYQSSMQNRHRSDHYRPESHKGSPDRRQHRDEYGSHRLESPDRSIRNRHHDRSSNSLQTDRDHHKDLGRDTYRRSSFKNLPESNRDSKSSRSAEGGRDCGRSLNHSSSNHDQRPNSTSTDSEKSLKEAKLSASRAAKLAQMEAAAKSLQESRSERLRKIEAEDLKRLEEEEAERERNRIKSGGVGDGTRAKFVRDQESKVFFGDMNLAERVKRSGGFGLVKERE
ncbi:Pre-mRNA splicing factor-domain-containing protein [Phakopsora pachyrhizi]|uniref:Pre-mRNA splicing factor-domain-containing protein n=1 Tax=Phakopsora pachyrhizi TaxID=170000 RepID=A0AAV0AK62_PHAPC|nr:Pre-mRNA splicing factor-domain-containing protein [Phakopsora pachyrhizi]CAH7667692.1 Pre-mRNA splicing factor-domain-containing protein [Phakopsora pachyrhizi]